MVRVKLTLCLFLFCAFIFQVYTSDVNENEQYDPQISAVLKYLNANPNKIYDYRKGTFVSAHHKSDIVELAVDVDATCSVSYPGVPCSDQILLCNGFIQYNEGDYRVLSDVLCKPKRDTSVENWNEASASASTPLELPQQDSTVELSHEAVSSEQNADFVAVKPDTVPCLGCPFDLNTNVEGVSSLIETGLKHIETERNQKHAAVKVIRLQRQVVAGVKYILTLEVAPTVCQKTDASVASCPLDSNASSFVCEIIFLEKPWISKEKLVIGNNCTVTQQYTSESKREISNDIQPKPNGGEMDLQRLADLESQIFMGEPEPKTKQEVQPSVNVQYQVDDVTTASTLDEATTIDAETEQSVDDNEETTQTSVSLKEGERVEEGIKVYQAHKQEYKRSATELNASSESSESEDESGSNSKEQLNPRKRRAVGDTSEESNSHSSESKDESGSNSKVQFNPRKRRDTGDNTNSHSSESNDESGSSSKEQLKPRTRRALGDTSEESNSHSSESNDDIDKNSNKHKRINHDSSESNSNSSESNSNSSEEKQSPNKNNAESIKIYKRAVTGSASSESNSNESVKSNETDSNSSESNETKRHRRDVVIYSSDDVRVKRKHNDNDDSSSSSSSSSSESKTDEDHNDTDSNKSKNKSEKIERKDDSSSSSSSSSSEDKTNEKKHDKRKNDRDSSSSSEDKTEEHKSKDDDSSSSSSSSSSSEDKEKVEHSDNDAVHKVKLVKRSIGQLEKITQAKTTDKNTRFDFQEEKFLIRDLADFAASSLDNIDDDNHKRIILQILGAKKLKLDGIYYHIVLRLGISRCTENEDDENCRKKLFENLTKICKVLVHVDDDLSNPKVVKSQCQINKKDDRDRNRTNYSRYRRGLVGNPRNISVDDPRVLEFTRDTITELDSKSEHPNRHKLVKITSATSQVVAGSKYRINAIISLSNCLKDGSGSVDDCEVLENAAQKSCDITVWDQPWTKHRETTVKCDDSDEEYKFEKSQQRNARSISSNLRKFEYDELSKQANQEQPEIVGGIEEASTDNVQASKYLRDILNYLDNESGHSNKLKVQDVLSVDKQVVAGVLWRIKARVTLSACTKSDSIDPQQCKDLEGSESRTCLFKIWDRPWLPNGKEVQTTCENESKPYSFRLKRSVGVGGWSKYIIPSALDDRNEPNPKLIRYIKSGLKYLDSKSVHNTTYRLKGVNKVTKQTVAGHLWRVEAVVVLSDCPKDSFLLYCEEVADFKTKTCQFLIWEQLWSSTKTQINITCDGDENTYSFTPHGYGEQEPEPDDSVKFKFREFMLKHNKFYITDTEYNYRYKVFRDNLNTIKLLNKYEQGTARYDVTRFADMTANEFSKSHGLRRDLHSDNENETPFANAVIPDIELPTEFDWRSKGAVTGVKDQGSCGSCWAFSTIGNIEGQYARKYGKLLEFSEQELVDCDKRDEGCNGGLMDNAYRTIEEIGGLETESDYPYDARDEKCHFNKSKVEVQLSGAVNISHNEDDMAKWLVRNGPISIAINANAMQFYMGGVSHPWKMLCSPNSLDHGVLIVGYGVHTYPLFNRTLPYWIVKNSWGRSWGEQGYYRVYRGDGTCGLNQTPSSAIVA